MIKNRVEKLKQYMIDNSIDAYIIPSADYHQSEYVGEYFKSRQYISGFTGSAGTVVVTKNEAGLWTDGRYFIQAEDELKDTGISLFKMGEPNVPTVEQYVVDVLKSGGTLGFDGKALCAKEINSILAKLEGKDVKVEHSLDLIHKVWEDRPEMANEKAFLLDVKYTGESIESKIKRIREYMNEKKATAHIISTLDDIAWTFNIRGGDVKFNPVVLSYALITLDKVYIFVDENKLNDEIRKEFELNNIEVKPYFDIYEFVKTMDSKEVVLLDPAKVNYSIYKNINENVEKIELTNPTILFKAVKNKVELENIRNSHIKDGVAFTKFMYWLKKNVSSNEITEISAAQKLEDFRREQDGFLELSFGTIAGYREHAAMMHYSATEESNYTLENKDLFLIDSGGQYYDGTTDITRTLALGEISDELRTHFTAVARGMIRLSMAKFLKGCRGFNLDMLARGPIWDLDLDYKCGTGHGIGFVLNVHEPPNGFRWKVVSDRDDSCVLEEGMVTTNEPGIYIPGSHGIRIENEIVVRKTGENEYGEFMDFEAVTIAPIDLDAIDANQMERKEKEYLNAYHKDVFNKISPFLTAEEKEWLKEYTREI